MKFSRNCEQLISGSITINLSNIPKPPKRSAHCKLQQNTDYVNLFEGERVRGWFPLKGVMKTSKLGLTVCSNLNFNWPNLTN